MLLRMQVKISQNLRSFLDKTHCAKMIQRDLQENSNPLMKVINLLDNRGLNRMKARGTIASTVNLTLLKLRKHSQLATEVTEAEDIKVTIIMKSEVEIKTFKKPKVILKTTVKSIDPLDIAVEDKEMMVSVVDIVVIMVSNPHIVVIVVAIVVDTMVI